MLAEKAAAPSACEPERKKAVSAGPAASVGDGVQPSEDETNEAPAAHGAHVAAPPML